MRKNIVAFLRQKEHNEVLLKSKDYFINNKIEDINNYRVNKFNVIWKDAYTNIKFYKKLKKKHKLPNRISKIEDIKKWPIITKSDLQENDNDLQRSYPPKTQILTGGSTGQPLRLGSNGGIETATNQWIGRTFSNITPNSKGFLIWGHHHLYGKNIFRSFNILKRSFLDFIMNYKRVSGYDLSEAALGKHFHTMIKYNPDYVIGYSTAILAFCKSNASKKGLMDKCAIRSVICTAGALNTDERIEISRFFGAEVLMEYGAAECGTMAYTTETLGHYKIFWDTHIFEAIDDNIHYKKNIVTTISNRYFPLIRYDICDYIETIDDNPYPVEVKNIVGRPSEFLDFQNGTKIYFALINDVLKQNSKVKALQVSVQKNTLMIYVQLTCSLLKTEEKEIIKKCELVAPDLKNINISIIEKEELFKTPSGKIRLIV